MINWEKWQKNKSLDPAARIIYRVVCLMGLLVSLYFIAVWSMHPFRDRRIWIVSGIGVVIMALIVMAEQRDYERMEKQEKELQMYRFYVQPLEEMTKEIRARQHEFDNHMNAILNMHLTIDNYTELVEKQSEYIKEIYMDDTRKYLNVLRISDKILAGFLYTKFNKAPENIHFEMNLTSAPIVTTASSHDIIEVLGTLIDNVFDEYVGKENKVTCYVDLFTENDKLVFQIMNPHEKLTIDEMRLFFEQGYSTKGENRGLGLYNAKKLTEKCGGNIFAGMENRDGQEYLNFRVEI
ncbi:MAG: GHKL domain-containing protein [Lachnospiraceae bacterium]|nr:GHKL domain-containing protein [Lachnospiraceae bacterium]